MLHLGRPKVDDGEAEQGERQRLMRERQLDRDEGEERRDAEPDLKHRHRGQDDGAAGERRSGRGAERGDGLQNRKGDDRIGDAGDDRTAPSPGR